MLGSSHLSFNQFLQIQTNQACHWLQEQPTKDVGNIKYKLLFAVSKSINKVEIASQIAFSSPCRLFLLRLH